MMIDIDYSANKLYSRLQVVDELLKGDITPKEKMILCNYKDNLFFAISIINERKRYSRKRHVFGSYKYYKKFKKELLNINNSVLDNIIDNKEFLNNYFGKITAQVEQNFPNDIDLGVDLYKEISMGEFNDIFYQFMKDMNLEGFLEEFLDRGRIYTYDFSQDSILGYTLFNPITHDTDILVGEFIPDIAALFTLAHEVGHAYDLSLFEKSMADYNRYYYQSFYGEAYSKLFERKLLSYMIRNDIMKAEAQDRMLVNEKDNHNYLLASYILTLLDDYYIEKSRYEKLTRGKLTSLVQNNFKTDIGEFIESIDYFDISEDFIYAFGDIVSMFLLDEVDRVGFSGKLNQKYLAERHKMFNPDFIQDNGLSPDKYSDLYKKQLKLLKK